MRCIICGQDREGSKEHIIPEALGNKNFITRQVCTECNNLLGTYVDNGITDDFVVKLIRLQENIRGKGGKAVKTFPSKIKGDDDRLYDFEASG